MASWGKSGNEHELSEITTSAIRMMDEDSQKGLLFNAIRGEICLKYDKSYKDNICIYLFICVIGN